MPKIPRSIKIRKPTKTVAQLVEEKKLPSLNEITTELEEIRLAMDACSKRLLDLTTKVMCFGLKTPTGNLQPVDDIPF
ncbi:hypothetical protein M0R72_07615 [Candidatus Pacearchaeota archaeon]|jgi:hypothetical protein|nr:hypothetical protein [Candidatus Pacearchaeota archaeon]